MKSILEGRPALRAGLYWVNTGAMIVVAILIAYFEGSQGSYPEELDLAAKLLLGLGVLTNVTAGTNIRGDALDPTALPPKVRKVANFVVAGLQGATLLSAILLSDNQAPWVDGANAVLLMLSGLLSGVAASHVVPSPPPTDEAQPEAVIGGGERPNPFV